MSNSTDIESKLSELIQTKNTNNVIQLYGEWGIGKTYLWNNVINGLGDYYKKKIVKVSLFDKHSISELKEDILIQISSINKTLNKYSKQIDTIQNLTTKALSGVTITSLSSLLKAKDFKDITISFDDIERRNKSFDFDTFLGYVSLLKEDKKCNVILILNYDKLTEDDKEIFDRYKEKIIDYNLILQKTPLNSLEDALNKKSIDFQNELKDIVEDIGIINIRLIKHMIKMITELDKINFPDYNSSIVKSFINAYIHNTYIHYKYGISDIKILFDYYSDKLANDEHFIPNTDYNEILDFVDILQIFGKFSSTFFLIFDNIMQSHFISKSNLEELKNFLHNLSIEKDLVFSVERINQLHIDYLSDMVNSIDFYYDDISKEIHKNSNSIVKQMSLSRFFYIIDTLKTKNSIDSVKLEEECIEHYNNFLIQRYEYQNSNPTEYVESLPFEELKNRNPIYCTDLINKNTTITPSIDCELINSLILKTKKYGDNHKDMKILNSINEISMVNCLNSSPQHLHNIVLFLKKEKDSSSYTAIITTTIKSFNTIYHSSNTEVQKKIETIFSYNDDKEILEKIQRI